jgi:hypothetical protein
MKPLRPLLASFGIALSLLTSSPLSAAAATSSTGSEVRIFGTDGKQVSTFSPFKDVKGNAGSIASADLGTDGVSELIIGAGRGTKPLVRIFRQDGSKIAEFLAYDAGFMGGVNVAVCDLNHDGQAEIITGAGFGGGPHVRIFSNNGTVLPTHFFAYDAMLRNGVNVACADVDGDSENEIITGQGPGGNNVVNVFSANGKLENEIAVGTGSATSGMNVAVGNIDTDAATEIIAMPMNYGKYDPVVINRGTWTYDQSIKPSGLAGATYGSSVTTLGGDIYLANGAYLVPSVTKLGGTSFAPFDGVNGYATLLSAITEKSQIAALSSPSVISSESAGKYIKVDISEQRLYAYENGIEVKSFLVSTATRGHVTPIGKTKILAKIPVMDYVWNYGPGNPNNYNIPNVKWNMRIFPHIYIHSAYWHNNFGHPMSHGCVNTSVPDAEWIYNWATVGTAVETTP